MAERPLTVNSLGQKLGPVNITSRIRHKAPAHIARHHHKLNVAALTAGMGLGVVSGASLYVAYGLFGTPGGIFNALSLLTAMIGASVLTLHHKEGVKRQSIEAQNARTPADAVEMKKQPSRAGV